MYAPPTADRPPVDVVDSTWVGAPAATLAPLVVAPDACRRWWPGLVLDIAQRRGEEGVRWTVRSVAGVTGATGTAEVWIESLGTGCVLHFLLCVDAPELRTDRGRAARLAMSYRTATKRAFWQLGDRLDPGRARRLRSPDRPARVRSG